MPPRKKTAPQPADAAAGDSAGISPAAGGAAVMVMVQLAELAPHPRNPRRQLGDLTQLTASIAAQGLFEPIVILTAEAFTAAAIADGDPERPAEGIRYVTVMGHRRAAAAAAAGLAEVPAMVRDDLAGKPARAAMVAENLHREDLTPLEEAAAMAELAACGWGQRKIAAEIGCSQAHVSKRLTLLQLPEAARDALADGKLTVADGLELHKLYGGGHDAIADTAIGEAVDSITQGYPVDSAIRQARSELARARAERATREQLERDGIEIVTSDRAHRLGWHRIWGDTAPHAAARCLAATIGYHGDAEYLCTNPASHPGTPGARDSERQAAEREAEREIRKAAKARDAACAAIAAGKLPPGPDLVQLLTTVVLGNGGGHGDALTLAWRWLRDAGAVPVTGDHYATRDQLAAAGDGKALQRFAYAYAVATDELHVRARYHAWGERHAAHLARLTDATGYAPTPWEQRQLAESKACAEARGTLACEACGCASNPGCDVTYDRDADKPVYTCAWHCTHHRRRDDENDDQDGEAGPAEDEEDD